jgi:dihydroorotase
MDYDLVLRNGHVIDPSQGINHVLDVGIREGVVAELGKDLPATQRSLEKDLRGKYVCPGLIDLHGHWYEGSSFGVDPNICLNHGVTTVVDAGTTGFINFPEFRKNCIDKSRIQTLAFIHIGCLGLPTTIVGELEDLRFARPNETARVIEHNRDVVLGVKIRQGAMTGAHGLEALEKALAAAKETGLPMMVHISKGASTPEILRKLRPGDIVTHCFQGRGDGIFIEQQEHLLPEVIEARKKGVFFDVGHGSGSFSWETARKAFELSFFPDTISTDLHRFSVSRWAIDMPTTMSKFLHIGMSLEEVILKSTWAPAKVINRDNDLGTLRKGTVADLFVFDIEEGEFYFEDTHLHTQKATRKLKPFLVVRKGELTEPGSYPIQLRELYECDREALRFVEETAS